ncbi:MAG: hypothetical protein M3291_06310 [Actinomycetota bacterium]|nr:hypothetical protein [Actinomycetota bacterium]
MSGALRVGGSVRARDLAMGMALACTSLVANAVVSGGDLLAPRTAAALPEPFTVETAGPQRGGASVVAMTTAFAASTHPLPGSGLVVPDTGTAQPDDGSLGQRADAAEAPAGAVPVEPVEPPVAVPPEAPPASEPVREVPGEAEVAPVLQPVTELLTPGGVSEVTEPALSTLNPPLFA